jgi:hypothetical protein
VYRSLPDPASMMAPQVGDLLDPRLVDQNIDGKAFSGEARAEQEKISQMGAESDDSVAFRRRRVQVLDAADGNLGPESVERSLVRDAQLDEVAEKIAERAAHDSGDLAVIKLVSQRDFQVPDRAATKFVEEVKAEVSAAFEKSQKPAARHHRHDDARY